ncbi:hypothetical protein B0J11DRAFT_527777 [Dendryphion nanum]|uniref:C2H2-type domain-containing protein n=1 Tax=Dendryphion nanum TaxID=256645 RepID=A0A9P9DUE5_9PLEO|nr:hypothetical protein B0J11DRAFT_527777 [Dendryphion nanum]
MSTQKSTKISSTTHLCAQCHKSFSNAHSLSQHYSSTKHRPLAQVPPSSKTPLPCSNKSCKRTFKDQAGLEQHLGSFVHKNVPATTVQKTVSASTLHILAQKSSGSSTNNSSEKASGMPISVETGLTTRTNAKSQPKHAPPRTHVENQSQDSTSGPLPSASHDRPYMKFNINDVYIVATPCNGGAPLISSLRSSQHQDQGGFDYALLLPTSQRQMEFSTQSSCCRSCGHKFTDWDSLELHFKTLACPKSTFNIPNKVSTNPDEATQNQLAEIKMSNPLGCDTSKKSIAEIDPRAAGWCVIPQTQQAGILTLLDLACHSPSKMAKNKYKTGSDYAKISTNEGAYYSKLPTFSISISQIPKRSVIAIDCEMVGVGHNGSTSEIAHIAAIDVLTREIIIDSLVQPTRSVTDWRTQYSGITKNAMMTAVAQNCVLKGWREARAELWKHMDAKTILVGHALQHDLQYLRMQHSRIVDSAILATDAVGPEVRRQWGLKTLCQQLRDKEIQTMKRKGHDPVEDAFAAREVVMWCITHPKELEAWASKRREEDREARRARAALKSAKMSVNERPPWYRIDDDIYSCYWDTDDEFGSYYWD